MLKNYAKVALRNLVNHKSYATINIVGLALGLAAFLMIAQYVSFELSYDRFHKNVDDIFRIRHDSYRDGISDGASARTFAGLASAMKETIPEIAEATHFFALGGGSSLSNDHVVYNERKVLFADASFLQLFSFRMKAGSSRTALAQPNSVVLTATSARKYFGESDPVGKLLIVRKNDSGLDETVKVTGVVEDPPPNSHIQFDVLFSIGTGWAGGIWGDPRAWEGPSHYTYAKLALDASPEAVAARLPLLVDRFAAGNLSRTNATARLSLQPVRDIRLYSHLQDELTPTGTGLQVWTLMGAGFFILVIAWVNYVNLATARSMRRAREAGMRKLLGARRGELVKQFMLEAGILTLPAVLVALILVRLSQPYLFDVTNTPLLATMKGAPAVWLFSLTFIGIGTLLSGSYPAFLFSTFPPALVLKGIWSRSARGARLRKGLIVLQFTASALLIATALTVHAQMTYLGSKDLGFDPEQTLVVLTPNVRADDEIFAESDRVFRAELLRYPAIQQVTYSSSIPGETIGWITPEVRREGSGVETAREYKTIEIGAGFLEQFGLKLVAGSARDYDPSGGRNIPCLLNEAAVKALGFESSEAAVGRYFISERPNRTDRCEIQGVVRNFHQRSLREAYEPIILRFAEDWVESSTHYLMKVETGDLASTLSRIETHYRAQFPGNAFEYFFLDDFFNVQYEADRRFGVILSLFTVVAAAIAFLGLFGLASFSAEQRTKEIGIRKVLGASAAGIVWLLTSEFAVLVAAGIVVGLPLAYLAVQGWLNEFAFRISIGWWFVAAPGIAVVLIALLAVGYQSLRTALADPVKSLRYE